MSRRVLIISAMGDVELNYLMELISDVKKEVTPVCTYYIGNLDNKEIILADCNVGLINTAAALSLGIEKYKPDIIINQGCAGGTDKNVHKGDIVIGTKCINITSARSSVMNEGEGTDLSKWELINFIKGETDRLVVLEADDKLINIVKKVESKYLEYNVHYGVIGSGDVWNNEFDRIVFLNEKYHILCEEMEGYAVYSVADKYMIPVIDIRVISDNLLLGEEYEREISVKCQQFIEKYLCEIN